MMNAKKWILYFLSSSILFISCYADKNRVKRAVMRNNESQKPNVIFFIADDMYPWMFNNLKEGRTADGKPMNLTPNIDRLAREGVWLENMKVVSPVCTPSRYSCLTGAYASRAENDSFTGFTKTNDGQTVIQWNSFIVPGQNTMGSYFQDMGYVTGFFGKNHAIESKSQVGETGVTFDIHADPKDPKVRAELEDRFQKLQQDVKSCGFNVADRLYHNNPNWLGNRALAYQNMDWIAEGGVNFIHENKNRPFLMYFATTLPHGPLDPEHSWKADRRITARGILDKAPEVLPQPAIESIQKRIKEAGLEGKNRENLLWLDDALGAIFKQLEADGTLDNTIIVFFNDHGQQMKGSLYEGGVNSEAFVWKKSGFPVGRQLNDIVSNVDFLPTLLDLVGAKVKSSKFDGKSFKPALMGQKSPGRTSMYHELGYARAVVKDGFKYYAVRHPKWAVKFTPEQRKDTLAKYTKFRESFGEKGVATDYMLPYGQLEMVPGGGDAEHNAYSTQPNFTAPDQLYDLKNDPQEKHNLINDPKYAEQLKMLKAELKKYLKTLPGKFKL